MTAVSNRVDSTRSRVIAYWVVTGVLAAEGLVGGIMAMLQLELFVGIIRHLGYPVYFMTIHGASYMLAGIALLVPRRPLLKEWAYAGLFFTYIGAMVSHLAVGDGFGAIVAPLVFTGLVCASWALRPSDRRV
jgi:heme A synthase